MADAPGRGGSPAFEACIQHASNCCASCCSLLLLLLLRAGFLLKGLRWMVGLCQKGFNGILADDMGLGKTVQVLIELAQWVLRW
jgi:hypothetical protein